MLRLALRMLIPVVLLHLMTAPLTADQLSVSKGESTQAAEEFECDDPTSFLCFLEGNVLCTQGGRFRVQVEWRDFEGNSGQAQAKKLTPNSGYFWFFEPDNAELYVKVLDGRQVNGHHWVFFGSASNVEFKVCVTDIFARVQKVYENPLGEFASIGDAVAFRSPGVCGTIAGLTCPEDDVCELPPGQCDSADLAGSCVERPEACPEIFDPVCGCDGVTYSNDCFRLMAGVVLDHLGEC